MHVDWGDSEVAGSRRGSREDIGGHQFVDHGIHLLSPSPPPQGLSVFLYIKKETWIIFEFQYFDLIASLFDFYFS